jgi:hypothetical protein
MVSLPAPHGVGIFTPGALRNNRKHLLDAYLPGGIVEKGKGKGFWR